jgi:phenylalanyl-tRNA synthetase beta chain
VALAGQAPADPEPFAFDPAYVKQLSGMDLPNDRIGTILGQLGFLVQAAPAGEAGPWIVTPPSWRRDVSGKADLVEEVTRIHGFQHLPATPLPDQGSPSRGVLNPRQGRVRIARRALAALGYAEAVTWSFTRRDIAALFGGGDERLVVDNPIASDLDCMRPSVLPNLIQAAARNAARGHGDVALFEIGPIYLGDQPNDQRTVIAGLPARACGLLPRGPGRHGIEAEDLVVDALAGAVGHARHQRGVEAAGHEVEAELVLLAAAPGSSRRTRSRPAGTRLAAARTRRW